MKTKNLILAILALATAFAPTLSEASHSIVLYDRTVQNVRIGVFDTVMTCHPGTEPPMFSTPTMIEIDAHWVRVADPEFASLNINRKLYFTTREMGDTCKKHVDAIRQPGEEFVEGTARRVVTERFTMHGLLCMRSLKEEIVVELRGYKFKGGDQHIVVGPVATSNCSPFAPLSPEDRLP